MGLFRKRKSRATRRAEARAIKARAKLEAKLAAKNEARRIKAARRAEDKALRAQIKAQRDSDRTALKVAEAELKAAREGKLLSPTRIRRVLTVSRLLAPILDPGDLPGRHGGSRADRPAPRGSARDSVGSDRPVLRSRRRAVGPHRRVGEVVADGAGQEAQGRRDQAVRLPPSANGSPICRRPSPPRRTCPPRDAGGPRRDLVATRRYRGGPDGPARIDLKAAARHVT